MLRFFGGCFERFEFALLSSIENGMVENRLIRRVSNRGCDRALI